jgi:two-component system, chemotaxis family, chemotaxis protein CheY
MKKTALIVDDDPSTRFVLSRALEGIGLRVVQAEDGAEVPELLGTQRFELLVIDLYMPGMNGFELLRRIRRPATGLLPAPQTLPTVRVLVVSGESHAASLANAKALGADAYLTKPVDLDVFEQTVGALIAPAHAARRKA